MYKEISRKDAKLYTIWTAERIKKAFNFGHGTMNDLKKYMENNKQFAIFEKC